jgi:iron complex transport system ATP-binding protein
MADPELLLLDEPAAGLDLGARERLVSYLARLAADPDTPPLVLVTHHTEEIPPGTTHAALLRSGRLVAAGPISDALSSAALSACYEMPVELDYRDGRWWSRAAPG